MSEKKASLEILKKAKRLEMVSKRNSVSLLDGHYRTHIPGRGTEFREARKYVPGESVRLIDWNMTARLGEPHVKIFQEERERNILIALDTSPSMFTGFQEKTKVETAVELAATLAYSGISVGDRVGLLLFQEKIVKEVPVKRGHRHMYQILSELVYALEEPSWEGKTDVRSAIHAIQKYKGSKFVVFLISDFIDLDMPDDFRYLTRKHDVSLIHVYDRMEYTNSKFLKFIFSDPEDRDHVAAGELDKFRNFSEQEDYLTKLGVRYEVDWGNFPTHSNLTHSLVSFFQKKMGR